MTANVRGCTPPVTLIPPITMLLNCPNVKVCGGGACSGLYAVTVKLLVALCGGDAESVTVATKPAVPAKLTVPDRAPVWGSMEGPSTNSAVGESGAMDQVGVPTTFTACSVTLYAWFCKVPGSMELSVIASRLGCPAPPPTFP